MNKKNYPYRKPNIGDICVAGPLGTFKHEITICGVSDEEVIFESKEHGRGRREIEAFKSAIEEGWWKYKYNFNHYLKQAELCK